MDAEKTQAPSASVGWGLQRGLQRRAPREKAAGAPTPHQPERAGVPSVRRLAHHRQRGGIPAAAEPAAVGRVGLPFRPSLSAGVRLCCVTVALPRLLQVSGVGGCLLGPADRLTHLLVHRLYSEEC